MTESFTDYYELLEIKPQAGQESIKKAFRNKAKKLHPDLNRGESVNRAPRSGSDSAMKLLLKGYAVL
ncbi:MAG: hypothetical protein E4H36_12615, partial [Spirochaetales bacterium]